MSKRLFKSLVEGIEEKELIEMIVAKQGRFDRIEFEIVVEDLRRRISSQLYLALNKDEMVVDAFKVKKSIRYFDSQSMQAMFFTGYGDLFHDLIRSLEEAECSSLSVAQSLFSSCVPKSTARNDPLIDRFYLEGDDFCLGVELNWPLSLLFPLEILESYKALYRWIFVMKKALFRLSNDSSNRLFLHFINSLVHYVLVDVVQSKGKEFADRVRGSQDFEEIQSLHASFLKTVLRQSFISVPSIFPTLQKMVQSNSNEKEEFKEHCSYLLRTLTALTGDDQSSMAYFDPFLLVFNFNKTLSH